MMHFYNLSGGIYDNFKGFVLHFLSAKPSNEAQPRRDLF
jgi:hypothetical protein